MFSIMDVAQIEAFLAIARLGSFTKAAAKLNRSQPAVSRRIALLEEEVGAPLFERIRKRVQLTDAGRALRPHAAAVLAAATSGIAALHEQLGQGAGTVSLGIVGTLVDRAIARALAQFSAEGPPSRLRITTTSSEAVSELVREGEVTLGVRYFADTSAELACTQLGTEDMVVVSAPGRQRPRDKHLARSACWIAFSKTKLMREDFGRLLARRLDQAGIEAPKLMVVDSLSAQKRMVEAGFGLGFLPYSSVARELDEGTLMIVDMPAVAMAIPITLVQRRGGYLSPAARMLIEVLRDAIAQGKPRHIGGDMIVTKASVQPL